MNWIDRNYRRIILFKKCSSFPYIYVLHSITFSLDLFKIKCRILVDLYPFVLKRKACSSCSYTKRLSLCMSPSYTPTYL